MASEDIVPFLSIQSDWNKCLRGRDKEAWISYKYRDQASVTGKLKLLDGKISCSEGFEILAYHGDSVTLKHIASGVITAFHAPVITFTVHDKACTSIDVSHGGLGVSAGSQGDLFIWETERGVIRCTLKGHIGDIYRCKFFPSGVVVLAGGADWRTRIWCAMTGQCPVTLGEHTGPVTDLAIIDRGKNIITTSKDGTARLWNVGESLCLGILCKLENTSITCCVLTSSNRLVLPPTKMEYSEKEVGTEDKILAIGGDDGLLLLIGVRARAELSRRTLDSPVTAVALINNEIIAVGLDNGEIHLISILDSKLTSIKIIHESNSPIKSLVTVREQVLLAGLGDGSCVGYEVQFLHHNTASVPRLQLTGSNFDPIYGIAWDGKSFVFTASRDGNIRKYKIENPKESLMK
ncbi:proteasomal ATPase-associated factor 1 [Cephus cinctus]|uniref:Proteasomal ATPase-associated factor 1 n=1 Tax=Cephus cinctus TaxID=211228 RepID=A0AAJ7C5Y9_CEPCN|nr:proteasomal ATPase-associated factor 1 [Cephus cinctus]